VTNLLVSLLGALLATNPPAAVSNLIVQTTGISVRVADPNDPVEKEYRKLMEEDDAALAEVDQWIKENRAASTNGQAIPDSALNERIRLRLEAVRRSYETFLNRHPDHVSAHLAFGSFLDDIKDEEASRAQIEKALELDPKDPAAWNNLANHYSHTGPASKMFEYYQKAIDLNPSEAIYYQNLADAVFVYRAASRDYYKLADDQEVYNKSLEIYQKAFRLNPTNFTLATELANNYYGIKPTRTDEALNAWSNALNIAQTPEQQQGVYLHLARFNLNASRFAEAHRRLDAVTIPAFDDLKKRLQRNLAEREKEPLTNAPPPAATPPQEKK
jgi:tetratricopeptide (TPR) repeat protein